MPHKIIIMENREKIVRDIRTSAVALIITLCLLAICVVIGNKSTDTVGEPKQIESAEKSNSEELKANIEQPLLAEILEKLTQNDTLCVIKSRDIVAKLAIIRKNHQDLVLIYPLHGKKTIEEIIDVRNMSLKAQIVLLEDYFKTPENVLFKHNQRVKLFEVN